MKTKSAVSVVEKSMRLLKESDELFGVTYDHPETIGEHKGMLKLGRGYLKEVMQPSINDTPNDASGDDVRDPATPPAAPGQPAPPKGNRKDYAVAQDDDGNYWIVGQGDHAGSRYGPYATEEEAKEKLDAMMTQGEPSEEPGEPKRGKPKGKKEGGGISNANVLLSRKAYDIANELSEDGKMHRMGKSAMREAKGYLKQVLKEAGTDPDENPGVEGGGDNPAASGEANPGTNVPGEKPDGEGKSKLTANDLASRLTGNLLSGKAPSPGVLMSLREAVNEACDQLPERMLAGVS